uniref:hypothetical protein n=1 Tax=Agathobacter sp. TaxID=2021311 RepID=UPI0040560FF9
MKLKRCLVILLALSMLTCVTACGGNDEEDVKGNISSNDENASDTEEEVELSLGTSEGGVYESTFMGLGWNLPEGWEFLSQAEMEQMNQAVIDMMDEDTATQLEEGAVFCDMYAFALTGDTVNIQIEKLQTVTSILVDEESYAELSIENTKDAFTQMGYTDVTMTQSTVTIAGKEHVAIDMSLTDQGVVLYEKMGLVKVGDYMCVITAASVAPENLDTIFAGFYALEK